MVVVVCIFHYFRLYLQKSIKIQKEEKSGTTGTGVSQKDLQRGQNEQTKKCHLKGEAFFVKKLMAMAILHRTDNRHQL